MTTVPSNHPEPNRKEAILRDESGTILARVAYPSGKLMEEIVSKTLSGGEYPVPDFLSGREVVIVDVGANVGAAAVFFRCVYPHARIYCYEPAPEAYSFAVENLRPFDGVQVFPFGWYDKNCRVPLYTGKVASVTSSIVPSFETGDSTVEIELRQASTELDRLMLEHVSILKLDTEGCEVPILLDLEPMLDRVESLLIEYHSERDRREIDRILADRFALYYSQSRSLHRGVVGYVANRLVAEKPNWNAFAIPRPIH
ncbi:MAG: FkbM family methyltransferase [Planctomycetaceae bacterium]